MKARYKGTKSHYFKHNQVLEVVEIDGVDIIVELPDERLICSFVGWFEILE